MLYRTICTHLWTDPKIQRLTVHGKLLFLYLITNPHTHLSGIYYLPKSLMTTESGLSRAILDTLLDTLSDPAQHQIQYDTESSTVFVVNMFRYQGTGEKNERAAANQLKGLHHTPLIASFLEGYPSVRRFCSDTLLHTLSHTPYRLRPSVPDPDPDPDPSSESSLISLLPNQNLKSKSQTNDFEQFWLAYPKKVGKKAARVAWRNASDRPGLPAMLEAVSLARRSEQWTKDNGQFIPHPSTWLNQGRWADQPLLKNPTTMDAFLSRHQESPS